MSSQQTPGDKLAQKLASLGPYFGSFLHFCLALGAPTLFISADIYLGPQFMTAYVESNGLSGPLTTIIPWASSFATTGFQYLMVALTRQVKWKDADKDTRFAILIMRVIWLFDTGSDVAGMTAWRWSPEEGVNVFPHQVGISWIVLALLTIGVCGGQEYFLSGVLEWQKGEVGTGSRLPGAKLLEKLVAFCNLAYGGFRGVTIAFSVLFVLILDVALSIYFFKTMFESDTGSFQGGTLVISVIISVGLSGFQILLYRQIRRTRESWHLLDEAGQKAAKRKLMFSGVLTLADIYFDISGFTMMMYGPEEGLHMVPSHPDFAWFLLAGVIFGLCGFYEPVIETAFGGLGFKNVLAVGATPSAAPAAPSPVYPSMDSDVHSAYGGGDSMPYGAGGNPGGSPGVNPAPPLFPPDKGDLY